MKIPPKIFIPLYFGSLSVTTAAVVVIPPPSYKRLKTAENENSNFWDKAIQSIKKDFLGTPNNEELKPLGQADENSGEPE